MDLPIPSNIQETKTHGGARYASLFEAIAVPLLRINSRQVSRHCKLEAQASAFVVVGRNPLAPAAG